MPEGNTTTVPRNSNGSYTIYQQNDTTVTLSFPGANDSSQAQFEVVKQSVPPNNEFPTGYTWVVNFGVKNPGGQYLPSVTYKLEGSSDKIWYIYYGGQVRSMNGTHENAPGDPPIGFG